MAKFYSRNAPPRAIRRDYGEFAGGKVELDESQQQALVRELNEELGIEATVGEYVASHQREVSGRIIHLHALARTRLPRDVTGT